MRVGVVEDQGGSVSLLALLDGFGFELSVCSIDVALSTVWPQIDVLVVGGCNALRHQGLLHRRFRTTGPAGEVIAVVRSREDGVSELNAGVDDFVVEPVDAAELVSRVRAALRRHRKRWQLRWHEVNIDRARRLANLYGKPLTLTAREYDLLVVLVEAAGEIVSRADLLAYVWGQEHGHGSNLVEVHVSRLRDKLGSEARIIDTVRGIGYRMRK